jgi:hypothetical protein
MGDVFFFQRYLEFGQFDLQGESIIVLTGY